MNVLVVEPMRKPYNKEIDGGLESLQREVGGCIEAHYPFADPVALICNGEGKLNGMQLNRAIRYADGAIFDVIAGTFLISGLSTEDFDSLSPELSEKYEKLFHTPELFIRIGKEIVAIPAGRSNKHDWKNV